MGPGLADGRARLRRERHASGARRRCGASGSSTTSTGTRFLLHDGRARTFEEAILWHGGEGRARPEAFRDADRTTIAAELIAFLEAL